jgi:ankyrin repeat protein
MKVPIMGQGPFFNSKCAIINTALMFMLLSLGLSIGATNVAAVSEKPSALEISRAVATTIAAGDVDAFKALLKSNPSAVNIRDLDKRTPLHYCAERPVIISADGNPHPDLDYRNWLANSKVMAGVLVAHRADVNAGDVYHQTPLHYAARSGNMEVARVLLANKADVNAKDRFYSSTALHIVAWNGNTAFARLLLENGAKVNAMDKSGTPLIAAIEDHRDMVELLLNSRADVQIKNPDGFAPIHLAGNKDIAQLLFSHGAILETSGYHGRTPLHQASMRNRNDVVEWLCAKGVKVNAVDSDGQTPLSMAISQPRGTAYATQSSMETMRILLRCGADISYRDKEGRTLLHDAVRRDREDIVYLLLKHGADINAKDKYGYTSLHWAVSSKNKEMVELLVARGADVNARNLQGRTPLYDTWGGSTKDAQIAEILKSHGGTK